jgi:tetratricopeptide (TPR) repeat protein
LGYQKGVIKALNLLGDVYTHTKHYDFAVKYYEKSMFVAKRINAKLLYGLSAVELGMVFISLGENKKALKLEQEIAEIVLSVPNRQLIFEHQILKSNCLAFEKKTKVAIQLLEEMLKTEGLYPEEESIVCFELVKNNPTDEELRQKTTTLHIERYRLTGQYLYLSRLNKLRK